MAREVTTVPFEEFSSHLEKFFDRVVHDNEIIIVEKQDGEVVVVKPAPAKTQHRRKKISEADHQAFIHAAGSWSDFDVDTFLENINESRRMSSRPPVEL